MTAIYQEKFKITSYLINPERLLTTTCLLQIFQEMAYNHVKYGGFDDDTMQELGLFWVLNRLRLSVTRYPKWHEDVTVESWLSRSEAPFFIRNFRMLDEKGKELANASSLWILLDSNTRRPIKVFDDKGFPWLPGEHADCGLPEKVKIPKDEIEENTNFYTVKNSDLDIANHCNNTRFVSIVLDTLRNNTMYNYLEINYNHEAMLDDLLEIKNITLENDIYFKIENEGKNICLVKIS